MQRALQVQEADWIQQPSQHPDQEEEEEEPIPLDDFYCPLCDKSFKSQKALANHERLHPPPLSPCLCLSPPHTPLPLLGLFTMFLMGCLYNILEQCQIDKNNAAAFLSCSVACPAGLLSCPSSNSSVHTNQLRWQASLDLSGSNGHCECEYCCFCGLPFLSNITLLLDELPWQG